MSSNYTSVYSIKDMAINTIAPKYFNLEEVNQLNIGLLGYTTELIANNTEDVFNTASVFLNEMFPNLAVLPETLYTYASMFQLDTLFANASELNFYVIINIQDILNNATRVRNSDGTSNNDLFEFFLDSSMVVDIEGIPFSPDYDIKINYKPYRGDYIFTAMYNMQRYGGAYTNSISNINNPYIKTKRIKYNNEDYLMLVVTMHQVTRFTLDENIIDNDVINLPTFTIEFEDSLASFEVFYKEPGDINYTQLKKRMLGTSPIKEPFCYYQFIDENVVEISFSSRDNYFQPVFNAELNIDYMQCLGSKGNFPLYKGNDIIVTIDSDKYYYNSSLTIFAIPSTESVNGADRMTMDQLRSAVVTSYSTVKSYTTENDLQLYFNDFNTRNNTDVLFIKKRDDIFERLFTSFTKFKDKNNDIYHTNTLNLDLIVDNFDLEYEQSDAYIMKPGHIFTYKTGILDTVEMTDKMLTDITGTEPDFIYTNPFLIYFSKKPNVGYYLNSVDSKHILDYVEVNNSSLVQFIVSSISIKRNALLGEQDYILSLNLTPTTDLDNPLVIEERDEETGELINTTKTNSIVLRMMIDDNGHESVFTDMELDSWDLDNNIYTFKAKITTDDYFTISNKMRISNFKDIETNEVVSKMVPMNNCKINIYAYYKYFSESSDSSIYELSGSLEGYTFTNKYSSDTNRINFISPLPMIKSTAKYIYNNDGHYNPETGKIEGGSYNINVSSSPVIGAKTMVNNTLADNFLEYLTLQYNYIQSILNLITNNFSVDMKFYNTYGKSKNFRVGDEGNELLDRVNISIFFKVSPEFGADQEELVRDLKIYIKNYIEGINKAGTNTIYISNLIQGIENDFPDVKYLKFVQINDYDSSVQVIENFTTELDNLSKEDRINYVPEYLTISLDDVIIEII